MLHPLRVRVVVTVFVACLVAAAPVTAQREVDRPPRAPAPERVAILPFVNVSGAPGDDWIGAGIAETLAAEFPGPSAFDVIGPELVADTIRGASVDGTGPAEHAVALEVGRRLGARWVVSGGYQRLGDQLPRVLTRVEFFVVYSEGRDTDVRGCPGLENRAFVVKFNRLFRF